MTKPVDIVNQFYDAWNKKDPDAIGQILSNDAEYEGPLLSWKGKEQYMEGVKQILPGFGGMKVLQQFTDDNTVCSILALKLNTPDGQIDVSVAEVAQVLNGKWLKSKTFYDPRKIEKYCPT